MDKGPFTVLLLHRVMKVLKLLAPGAVAGRPHSPSTGFNGHRNMSYLVNVMILLIP